MMQKAKHRMGWASRNAIAKDVGLNRCRGSGARDNCSLSRRGMALVVVLVLTMLVALGAYRYVFHMESQYGLTRVQVEMTQAELAAVSGLELAAQIVDLPLRHRTALGGVSNNPAYSGRGLERTDRSEALLRDTANAQQRNYRFALVQSRSGSDTAGVGTPAEASSIQFGLVNESAKLHIPTLLDWDRKQPGYARNCLMRLPGASEELVNYWLAKLGALPAASRISNETTSIQNDDDAVEGLLRYRWLGGDMNQDMRIDSVESRLAESLFLNPTSSLAASASPASARPIDMTSSGNPDGLDAPVDAWNDYLTWHSGHRNENADGMPKINLNAPNLAQLHQQLLTRWPADWARFVIALRQFGPSRPSNATGTNLASKTTGSPSSIPAVATPATPPASNQSDWVPDFGRPAVYQLASVADLFDAVVEIPSPGGATSGKQRWSGPFSADSSAVTNYLGRVLDEATVSDVPFVTGKIDIREAPLLVLLAIPGMDAGLAERISQQRESQRRGTAVAEDTNWLFAGNVLTIAKFKELEKYISFRSDVYRVQSVGFATDQMPTFRYTALIDGRRIPASIHQLQTWHAWGRGFVAEQLVSTDVAK